MLTVHLDRGKNIDIPGRDLCDSAQSILVDMVP